MTLTADDIMLLKSQLIPPSDSDLKLYAIMDAGVAGDDLLNQLNVVHQVPGLSLMPGDERYGLKDVSPLLIDLTNQTELLEWLLENGWQNNWGIYLQTPVELSDLYHHLYTLTCVRLPDGKAVYFRYHDPRILRPFFSALTPEQGNAFLGPNQRLFVEQEDKIKPRYYQRPEGLEEQPPAPTPSSWTSLPEPWWEVNQLQWKAINKVVEHNFIDFFSGAIKQAEPDFLFSHEDIQQAYDTGNYLGFRRTVDMLAFMYSVLVHEGIYLAYQEDILNYLGSSEDYNELVSRLDEVNESILSIHSRIGKGD